MRRDEMGGIGAHLDRGVHGIVDLDWLRLLHDWLGLHLLYGERVSKSVIVSMNATKTRDLRSFKRAMLSVRLRLHSVLSIQPPCTKHRNSRDRSC